VVRCRVQSDGFFREESIKLGQSRVFDSAALFAGVPGERIVFHRLLQIFRRISHKLLLESRTARLSHEKLMGNVWVRLVRGISGDGKDPGAAGAGGIRPRRDRDPEDPVGASRPQDQTAIVRLALLKK